MVIVGVDPGSRVTGYGVIQVRGNRYRCLDFGGIHTGGQAKAVGDRLKQIYSQVSALLSRYDPDSVAVEEVFYAANVKSALILGHARGVVLLAAAEAGVPLVEYSPLEIKKSVVGYGRADKRQVQLMVSRLLGLTRPPEPLDAADALAIALCHAFHSRAPGRRNGA